MSSPHDRGPRPGSTTPSGYLNGRWIWLLRQLGKRMWVRASLFSLSAAVIALLSAVMGHLVPLTDGLRLAAGAVDGLLDILASSMLAVTTFSLTTMVMAYSAAASHTSPRATHLLITDSIATTTLSTFVGSFLFAIVGSIGLSAELYGERGRLLLFFATLIVVAMVTVALLRWIDELGYFGRVGDTLARVEDAAVRSAHSWAKHPRLGARSATDPPKQAQAIFLAQAGFIQHVDTHELQRLSEQLDVRIYLQRLPGRFIYPDRPAALVWPAVDEDALAPIRACITVGRERSFDQDPRYGLVVLSEIASRALSPAVNDPGTAIHVLGSGLRVLLALTDSMGEPRSSEAAMFDRVYAPDLTAEHLVADFFDPIARDGRGMIEVQLRLQSVLRTLSATAPDAIGAVARVHAREAAALALQQQASEQSQRRLRQRAAWAAGTRSPYTSL